MGRQMDTLQSAKLLTAIMVIMLAFGQRLHIHVISFLDTVTDP